ncbi:unnamed protein product [Arctogadus glacialis]
MHCPRFGTPCIFENAVVLIIGSAAIAVAHQNKKKGPFNTACDGGRGGGGGKGPASACKRLQAPASACKRLNGLPAVMPEACGPSGRFCLEARLP